jgi:hypothetical protein
LRTCSALILGQEQRTQWRILAAMRGHKRTICDL